MEINLKNTCISLDDEVNSSDREKTENDLRQTPVTRVSPNIDKTELISCITIVLVIPPQRKASKNLYILASDLLNNCKKSLASFLLHQNDNRAKYYVHIYNKRDLFGAN